MPRLASFDGITIYMYAEDHNPPHVHVYYAEHAAIVTIATRDILAGFLPSRQRRDALAWIEKNEAELVANWDDLNS